MTDSVGSTPSAQNQLYWHRRELELTKLANALHSAVNQCKYHQGILYGLAETEKIGSEEWTAQMAAAGQSLRNARSIRTRFRKQLYSARDTLRIRPHLAQDAPDDLKSMLERGIQYLQLLEASGY